MPDGRHVLRPGAGSQSAKVVVEHDIEHPMQAVLDMPMAPHGMGEQLGVERHRGQVTSLFPADAAVPLDLGLDYGDGAQTRQARLAGEAPRGGQPVHVVADPVAANLDTAVIAVCCLEAAMDQGDLVVEVAPDLVVEVGLVVPQIKSAGRLLRASR